MSMKSPLTPSGIEPATFRFVAQHLNHCATAEMMGRKTVYRKKNRKISSEMDGQCGSRSESNEDKADDGENERWREMETDC